MNSTLHEKVAISRDDYLVLLSLDYSFSCFQLCLPTLERIPVSGISGSIERFELQNGRKVQTFCGLQWNIDFYFRFGPLWFKIPLHTRVYNLGRKKATYFDLRLAVRIIESREIKIFVEILRIWAIWLSLWISTKLAWHA